MRGERDITRLPKWAQQEIGRLSRDLEYAQKKLSAGPEDSVVFAHPYSDNPTPLGDADIQFLLGDQRFRVGIRESNDGSYLEVMGSNILEIAPQVTNVIRLRSGGRY